MSVSRRAFHVYGVVQGVGFRPFVYRIARKHGLKGYVLNMGDRVEIVVEGEDVSIERFLHELLKRKPPLCRIRRIEPSTPPPILLEEFRIEHSRDDGAHSSTLPPDVAMCDECLSEMLNPLDRRYEYPFTVCTSCGPRYSIVLELPYDRENTTMGEFTMCARCLEEYTSPDSRRYHAQPNCCSSCGPRTMLYDSQGRLLGQSSRGDVIAKAAELLDEGCIVAIKGMGGVHISVSTEDDEPLRRLRKALGRPYQPFAVMARDVSAVRRFAIVGGLEERLLTAFRRPIVVLSKSESYHLSKLVAPGLHTVGVMLPYSGIHHLLFRYLKGDAYVMTSANLPGRPMVIHNDEAFRRLCGVADYYLMHDLRIANRIDDSVLKVVDGRVNPIRRSRGYVPEPIPLPFSIERCAAGVGAEQNVTVCLAYRGTAYLSQHIGNTREVEVMHYFVETMRYLQKLTGIIPEVWGCDLHPVFNTTRYVRRSAQRVEGVQHHHAHMVSLMVDRGMPLESDVVCIALDGMGYGDDGKVWGGEVLVGGYHGYTRYGHLEYQPMPGGDLATYYPSRMALGILSKAMGNEELACLDIPMRSEEKRVVIEQLKKGINVAYTTSTGRVLDAVSALLGVCTHRSYEGEPAMRLESAAVGGSCVFDPSPKIRVEDGRVVLDTTHILMRVYEASQRHSVRDVAFSAEEALARGVGELAVLAAQHSGLDTVGLTGGVAYNVHITSTIRRLVENEGLKFITHERVPSGDGAISLGQAVIAALRDDGVR